MTVYEHHSGSPCLISVASGMGGKFTLSAVSEAFGKLLSIYLLEKLTAYLKKNHSV